MGMLLARPIRSYNYMHCFILHLTWGQTKRDMNTDNEEHVIQSSAFDSKLELRFRWPGHFSSVTVSCGNAVTITCFSPRMGKSCGNGWKWGHRCGRDWRRAALPWTDAGQHRAGTTALPSTPPCSTSQVRAQGTRTSEITPVSNNRSTAMPGTPRAVKHRQLSARI